MLLSLRNEEPLFPLVTLGIRVINEWESNGTNRIFVRSLVLAVEPHLPLSVDFLYFYFRHQIKVSGFHGYWYISICR